MAAILSPVKNPEAIIIKKESIKCNTHLHTHKIKSDQKKSRVKAGRRSVILYLLNSIKSSLDNTISFFPQLEPDFLFYTFL